MSSLWSRSSLFAVFCAAGVACSGGDDGAAADGGAADAGAGTDAGARPDAAQAIDCVSVADFGDQGAIDGNVVANATNAYLSIDSTLQAGPPVDLLVVELFGGYGALADGLATGTFPITGDETNYNSCGVCVSVYADFDPMTGSDMIYVAQSGTVTITSIEGNFAGTFVPEGETTNMVGHAANDATMMYEQRTDCTVTGGGASWDKAIPPATP